MKVDELLNQSSAWLAPGADTGIVVSSRIRLARNLRERIFPSRAPEDVRAAIWQELSGLLGGLPAFAAGLAVEMRDLDEIDRHILFERHLISRDLMARGTGSGVVVAPDETMAIMVNEEDHLRMQSMRPGLELRAIWQAINAVDDAIEEKFAYAFSPKLGYLTACPSNVGTGMRASVMLHVPGLVLMNEMNPIIKGMGKIGLAVRGLWGEGTDAAGNMFQVSNQISLGEKEDAVIGTLDQIVQELVEHEKNARARLLEKRDGLAQDHVGRAYGVLAYAHILNSREALDLLSALRLGIDVGIVKKVDRRVVDELLLFSQPGHLQKAMNKVMKPKERDRARAQLVRKKLAGLRP